MQYNIKNFVKSKLVFRHRVFTLGLRKASPAPFVGHMRKYERLGEGFFKNFLFLYQQGFR